MLNGCAYLFCFKTIKICLNCSTSEYPVLAQESAMWPVPTDGAHKT